MSEYYFQTGGGNMPYNFYHPSSPAFRPCDGCNVETPFTCGGQMNTQNVKIVTKKQTGGDPLPYRWFNPNSKPFEPCSGCNVGFDDFPINKEGCPCLENSNPIIANCVRCGSKFNQMGGKTKKQTGGNPVGAPMFVFTHGTEPFKYNYEFNQMNGGTPVFAKVAPSPFLRL